MKERFEYYYLEVREFGNIADIVHQYYSNSVDYCMDDVRDFLEANPDKCYVWEICNYNFK